MLRLDEWLTDLRLLTDCDWLTYWWLTTDWLLEDLSQKDVDSKNTLCRTDLNCERPWDLVGAKKKFVYIYAISRESSIRHWQLSETDRDKYKNQVSYTGFPFFLIDTHVQVGNLNSEQKILYTFWLRGLSRCHNKKAVPVSYLMITKHHESDVLILVR